MYLQLLQVMNLKLEKRKSIKENNNRLFPSIDRKFNALFNRYETTENFTEEEDILNEIEQYTGVNPEILFNIISNELNNNNTFTTDDSNRKQDAYEYLHSGKWQMSVDVYTEKRK